MLEIKLSGRIQCILAVSGFQTAKEVTTYAHRQTIDREACTEQSHSLHNYPTA